MTRQNTTLPTAEILAFPNTDKRMCAQPETTTANDLDYHHLGFDLSDALLKVVAGQANGMWVVQAAERLIKSEADKCKFQKGVSLRLNLGVTP